MFLGIWVFQRPRYSHTFDSSSWTNRFGTMYLEAIYGVCNYCQRLWWALLKFGTGVISEPLDRLWDFQQKTIKLNFHNLRFGVCKNPELLSSIRWNSVQKSIAITHWFSKLEKTIHDFSRQKIKEINFKKSVTWNLATYNHEIVGIRSWYDTEYNIFFLLTFSTWNKSFCDVM